MEIQINEFEKHIITFPEKMTSQEFCTLVDSRLIPLRKSMGGDDMMEMIKGKNIEGDTQVTRSYVKKNYRGRGKNKKAIQKLRGNRDFAIEFWKLYYSGDNQKLDEFIDRNKLRGFIPTRKEIMGGTCLKIRKALKITPKEIGLKEFPTKKNSSVFFKMQREKLK